MKALLFMRIIRVIDFFSVQIIFRYLLIVKICSILSKKEGICMKNNLVIVVSCLFIVFCWCEMEFWILGVKMIVQ